ncbi:glucose-6-phosphate dehydrogenase [Iningainema tapete]|uniref:Glucose-6-phosphate dehydrogenase n=1 Tax=Iningainema tapete BLCC-T55 TaxID=2748662 RepID=A0A8J6XNK4_9CYAN|nr:glucose-6-phosphate dehydrogenase [Iningainema tapete]MBD2775174.1 glucose-6-phosphate dehydrogenase [Iningainema tapete BLCC-T55]
MTAFSTSDIPSNIDTLEKLAAWVGLSLASINLTLTAIEAPNYSQRTCQAGTFFIDADNKHRLLIRVSLPMSSDHLSGTSNPWTYAEALSQTAIPNEFKVAA